MNRIISKEEEREDPRRDSSIYLRVQWCFHILQRTTRNPASFQSSRAKKTIVHTELILLQEFSKKYQNYKAHPMQIITRHLPATVPMYPTILHGRIRLPGLHSTSRLPVNSRWQKQHSKQQPASTQPLQ